MQFLDIEGVRSLKSFIDTNFYRKGTSTFSASGINYYNVSNKVVGDKNYAIVTDTTLYGVCNTRGDVAAKTVTVSNSKNTVSINALEIGMRISVKFRNTNSAASSSLTLSVNGLNAVPIKYNGSELNSLNTFAAGSIVDFIYDGSSWNVCGIFAENPHPDWDENDVTSGAYIQNRTHYRVPTSSGISMGWTIPTFNDLQVDTTLSGSKCYFNIDLAISIFPVANTRNDIKWTTVTCNAMGIETKDWYDGPSMIRMYQNVIFSKSDVICLNEKTIYNSTEPDICIISDSQVNSGSPYLVWNWGYTGISGYPKLTTSFTPSPSFVPVYDGYEYHQLDGNYIPIDNNTITLNNEGKLAASSSLNLEAVRYTSQDLTSSQKLQARTNIDAIGYSIDGSATAVELGLERQSNKVTQISASSTDVQYPSAKCVYDLLSTKSSFKTHTMSGTTGQKLQILFNSDATFVVLWSYDSPQRAVLINACHTDQEITEYISIINNTSSLYYSVLGNGKSSIELDLDSDDQCEVVVYCISGGSFELNETTTNISSNCRYPTEKADVTTVCSSIPSGGMLPNIYYALGTLSGSNTLTMANPTNASILNHYFFTFSTGGTAPTITWDNKITSWHGGATPTIKANKYYEISVIDGVGVYMEV